MQTSHKNSDNPLELLEGIRALIAPDLAQFDEVVQSELASSVPLTREITHHIFKTKGKRLRPLLVLLASHAFSNGKPLEKKHIELAIVIEFVHTATLLHDDVVDHSELRRGKQTANAIWGNAASVLVGDFLYSRAFQILARHQHNEVMQVLSETTNAIAEGEVLQLMNQNDPHLTEENYLHVITQKTARLFSAATEIGAILENAGNTNRKCMSDYGLHLGITFQMIDDLLDYASSAEMTGKNIGDDLRDGKATLPLIYAMKNTTPDKSDFIHNAIKNSDASALPTILSILNETNAFHATREKALSHAEKAEKALYSVSPSIYRNALADLITFAVERAY